MQPPAPFLAASQLQSSPNTNGGRTFGYQHEQIKSKSGQISVGGGGGGGSALSYLHNRLHGWGRGTGGLPLSHQRGQTPE